MQFMGVSAGGLLVKAGRQTRVLRIRSEQSTGSRDISGICGSSVKSPKKLRTR